MQTVPEYFTPSVAAVIRDEHGPAALVTANNVFAHSDQSPRDGRRHPRTARRRTDCSPSRCRTCSTSCRRCSSTRSTTSTSAITRSARSRASSARHGLELIDVQRIATKGGSLRGTVQLSGWSATSFARSANGSSSGKNSLGSIRPEMFARPARRMDAAKEQFVDTARPLPRAGKIVLGTALHRPSQHCCINSISAGESISWWMTTRRSNTPRARARNTGLSVRGDLRSRLGRGGGPGLELRDSDHGEAQAVRGVRRPLCRPAAAVAGGLSRVRLPVDLFPPGVVGFGPASTGGAA